MKLGKVEATLIICAMGVGFGAFALALGHNNTVIASVFALVGGAIGYIWGKVSK